jgi:hypothetical protein
VSDVDGGIHADAPIERVEILTEALPTPAESLAQYARRHPLYRGEEARHEVAIFRLAGRNGEATVSAHHGGDSVQTRGRGAGVEVELGVVVGVVVHDPRHDHQAIGVDDLARGRGIDAAEPHDATVADPHVGASSGQARAIYHESATYDEVQHGHSLYPTRTRRDVVVWASRGTACPRAPPVQVMTEILGHHEGSTAKPAAAEALSRASR